MNLQNEVSTPSPEAIEQLERAVRILEQPGTVDQPDNNYRLTAILEAVNDGEVLKSVGEPILLDRVGRVLRQDQEVAIHWPHVLDAIDGQHAHMADVHQKFAATLDLSVGIEDLLYTYLDTWNILEEPVGRRFSEDEILDLERLRWEPAKPSQRLRQFFGRYVAIIGSEESQMVANHTFSGAIESALTAYMARETRATVYALFADKVAAAGVCLPIAFEVKPGAGAVLPENEVGGSMRQAVQRAFTLGCHLAGIPREDTSELRWSIFEPSVYEGESIGLAAALGVASQLQKLTIDCYTAFTGKLAFRDGRVERVEYVREKLESARDVGFRRVFIPRQNLDEVADLASETFAIHAVDTIEEAWRLLQPTPTGGSPRGSSLNARVRRFELVLRHSQSDG